MTRQFPSQGVRPGQNTRRAPAPKGKAGRAPKKKSGGLFRRLSTAMAESGKLDSALVIIILTLLTYGLIMIFSASYPTALDEGKSSLSYTLKQGGFALVGVAAMFLASLVDYHVYRRLVFPLYIASTILLILVLIPGIGSKMGTFARRWIVLGPVNFQPSEVMKFAIIVMFAHLVSVHYKRMNTFRYGVLPFALCLGSTAVLMMKEPHTSGTVLIVGIGFIMMFVGGTKLRWFAAVGGAGVLGIAGIIMMGKLDYILSRLGSWLDPFAEELYLNDGWQTAQSLIAIGSGGIMGRGIGNSHQKYYYVSEPHNDFIFSIICEELGLVGALIVILLFILFALRGFSIAAKAPDKFGYMLAVGLTAQICLQAVLNIAVVTNTIPNTGISLPFFSYGGTALLMQLGQMGILLNISRHSTVDKT